MYNLIIAEDEVLERKALKIIVKKHFPNINVVASVSNGEETLTSAKKTSPDIILMDIKMPGMNGLECQKNIYSLYPDTKTIILTAYDDFNYAQYAVKVHAFDYLLKPVKPIDLVHSLNNAIDDITICSDFYSSVSKNYSSCPIINKAINYINTNYCEKITLDKVSSYIHLNSQYFSRYFKSKMGINFVDYLSRVRINNSKKLLLSTDQNIKCIALKVGFLDPAYFSKVFIKTEGISPIKFRNKKKHKNI